MLSRPGAGGPIVRRVTQPAASQARVTRRVRVAWMLGACLISLGVWWLLDFIPPSTDVLAERVVERPGVLTVVVEEPDGDDDIPFTRDANSVSLTMEADATPDEVSAVLHAYDDDIDDGDVGLVDMRFVDKQVRLALGADATANNAVIREVFDAKTDPRVRRYLREGAFDGAWIEVELEEVTFAEVVAYADRLGEVEPVVSVTVGARAYATIRDEQWGPASLAQISRREQAAIGLDGRFDLDGILVADRSPFIVRVRDAQERAAVREALARLPSADIGRFRVLGCGTPGSRPRGGPPLCNRDQPST